MWPQSCCCSAGPPQVEKSDPSKSGNDRTEDEAWKHGKGCSEKGLKTAIVALGPFPPHAMLRAPPQPAPPSLPVYVADLADSTDEDEVVDRMDPTSGRFTSKRSHLLRQASVVSMKDYLNSRDGQDFLGESKTALKKRDSQANFADPTQTCIIFDWDDTLFPTTFLREVRVERHNDNLNIRRKAEIASSVQECAWHAAELLRRASQLAKVVLVTLAKRPWVTSCCRQHYQGVGGLITELGVPVVYAQDVQKVDRQILESASGAEALQFWSRIKGNAIANILGDFYSQYEGQSWKNVISIGDSDFERLGTRSATKKYMMDTGIPSNKDDSCDTTEVSGHVYKVRTKTLKMIDQPTSEELALELAMVQQWLPLIVRLDGGCDINLNDVDDRTILTQIETRLRQGKKQP